MLLKMTFIVLLLGSLACRNHDVHGSKVFSLVRDQLKEKIVVRYVQGAIASGELKDVLQRLNAERGTGFSEDMFKLSEERELFSSLYRRYALTIDGVPVDKSSVRVWLDKQNGRPMQVEVRFQAIPAAASFREPSPNFDDVVNIARNAIYREHPMEKIKNISTEHVWDAGNLVRRVRVLGSSGRFKFDFANNSDQLLTAKYRPFERSDGANDTISFSAPLYPIWEWANNGFHPVQASELQQRIQLPVRNILKSIPAMDANLVEKSKTLFFASAKEKKGTLTDFEKNEGYWNSEWLNTLFPFQFVRPQLFEENTPESVSGIRLYGKNAIVMLHPDALKGVSQPQNFARAPAFVRSLSEAESGFRMVTPWWNKGAHSVEELSARAAVDAQGSPRMDDAQWLLQNGFDELQAYYSIDMFMESMKLLGFRDPELSVKPFSAFLFDPSIDNKDNAFCDGDGIYFSTYSANSVNYVRDNTTIWHELGHGVMGRLMGNYVDAVEGYGLWEGMADFVSEILITQQMGRKQFLNRDTLRIINGMWLYNSNESHDDGESYGGAMYDILQRAMTRFGVEEGLLRTSDLVLETMRLTRDLEELTPVEWFEHMKYADSLQRLSVVPDRSPGQMLSDIEAALVGRNYSVGNVPLHMVLQYQNKDIVENALGSRGKPVSVAVGKSATFDLVIGVDEGTIRKPNYPVTVQIAFRGGPLQGSVHWLTKEKDSQLITISRSGERVSFPVTLDGNCDEVNTSKAGCVDYVYVKFFNQAQAVGVPVGKKRFYVELIPNRVVLQ